LQVFENHDRHLRSLWWPESIGRILRKNWQTEQTQASENQWQQHEARQQSLNLHSFVWMHIEPAIALC